MNSFLNKFIYKDCSASNGETQSGKIDWMGIPPCPSVIARQKNKKIYNIKNNYFININVRVAKIKKGNYHHIGHF